MAWVTWMPQVTDEQSGAPPQPELKVEPALRAAIDAVRASPQDAWRFEPLSRKIAYARRQGEDVPVGTSAPAVDATLERIFNSPDFLAGRWLALGAARADAVAKITTQSELGTGFLVSPWLLLTNHHVLDSPETASGARAWFRYVEDEDGRIDPVRLDLQPERCFVTSPQDQLDFTFVAVEAVDGKPPGTMLGCIPMHGGVGKIVVGQPVNVVQHPSGRPREIAVRNNLLVSIVDDRFMLYGTDTEPGSSGSPVLSDAWELVGLHCASEPRRNAQHQAVDVDGNVADATTPESRRVWVANKGVRVSAIIADISARVLDPSAGTEVQALVAELLDLGGNR